MTGDSGEAVPLAAGGSSGSGSLQPQARPGDSAAATAGPVAGAACAQPATPAAVAESCGTPNSASQADDSAGSQLLQQRQAAAALASSANALGDFQLTSDAATAAVAWRPRHRRSVSEAAATEALRGPVGASEATAIAGLLAAAGPANGSTPVLALNGGEAAAAPAPAPENEHSSGGTSQHCTFRQRILSEDESLTPPPPDPTRLVPLTSDPEDARGACSSGGGGVGSPALGSPALVSPFLALAGGDPIEGRSSGSDHSGSSSSGGSSGSISGSEDEEREPGATSGSDEAFYSTSGLDTSSERVAQEAPVFSGDAGGASSSGIGTFAAPRRPHLSKGSNAGRQSPTQQVSVAATAFSSGPDGGRPRGKPPKGKRPKRGIATSDDATTLVHREVQGRERARKLGRKAARKPASGAAGGGGAGGTGAASKGRGKGHVDAFAAVTGDELTSPFAIA